MRVERTKGPVDIFRVAAGGGLAGLCVVTVGTHARTRCVAHLAANEVTLYHRHHYSLPPPRMVLPAIVSRPR